MNEATKCNPRRSVIVAMAMAGLLAGPCAAAGTRNKLYKCVNLAGVTSIQSVPCPAGSLEAWRRDATPEPALTPVQTAQAEARRLRDQQTVLQLSDIVDKKLRGEPVPAAASAPPAAPAAAPALAASAPVDACQDAQTFAAAVRDKPWLGLTDEQLKRLFGWLGEQCKPAPSPSQ